MEKVPKIVEERLKVAVAALDHPDPDALTAFSERALPEPERKQVLEHLARCAECREVIALALPAEEPMAVAPPMLARSMTWPRLRWALAATGIVLVGAFGALRYRAASHPATVASYVAPKSREVAQQPEPQLATPATTPEAKIEQPGAMSSGVPVKVETKSGTKEFDRLQAFARLQSSPNQQAGLRHEKANFRSQSFPHGPKPPGEQWQQMANQNANASEQQSAYQALPPPAVPPVAAGKLVANEGFGTQSVSASKTAAAPGPLALNKPTQKLDALTVQDRSTTALSGGNAGAEVARAKDAQPPAANAPKAEASAYDVSAAQGSNFSISGALVAETARWAINSGGGLQRSLDQGKTWQDVDVNNAAEPSSAINLRTAMKKSARVAAQDDKETKAKMRPIVFRAVSANGPDVWAGGSEGNLFHSTDAGEHWVRIVPSWRGIQLTTDILSLQFADPQNGRIVTSAAEIWTTADAGQTWDKH